MEDEQNQDVPKIRGEWRAARGLMIQKIQNLEQLLAAANKTNEALRRAANECLIAERLRRMRLRPGAPATTYCEARIARIEAALAEGAEGS